MCHLNNLENIVIIEVFLITFHLLFSSLTQLKCCLYLHIFNLFSLLRERERENRDRNEEKGKVFAIFDRSNTYKYSTNIYEYIRK